MPTTPASVMLAAGGTAGHLFPAFALAEELARRNIVVDLITDMRGDRYGADFPARQVYRVPAATLKGSSPLAAAKTGYTLTRGTAAAFKLLGDVKPAAVIGFGGYPTFPPLLAAKLRGIPSALHEANAVLGRANKMLAKRVSAIATSFDTVAGIDHSFANKVHVTGNPVRNTVMDWAQRAYMPPGPTGPFNLLIFGGSQGARFFSDAVPPALIALPEPVRRMLFVTQQARDEDVAAVTAAYETAGIRAQVAPFFKNLPEEIAKAHVVIARAGAGTVSELTVIGRPGILVPLPHALDNDQLLNARRVEAAEAGWCLEQKTLTTETLTAAIQQLLNDPALLGRVAAAAKRIGRPDAVARLADLVERLMDRRST
jgi:UDP-N-acetylglucosamine--N-acetylmuramyl-(pentapeptide) pyrophosphoryl-undecaprenol N-acetylglucosamine transferase